MVAERLIGDAAIDTPDNVAGTARMLGWSWQTSAADKVVKNIYVRIPSGGSFAAGTMAQLWKRAFPISSSTRLQNIDISSVTGSGGTWVSVPGVSQTSLVQNDAYFVTLYHPSTDSGAYWFKSAFGNPINGSLSGNCIFKNSGTVDQAPDDETFTDGAFAIDIEIDGGSMPDTHGWRPKVNRHCIYLQKKTFDGNAEYVKRRPAVITVVNVDDTVNLRVGHHGETYINVPPWSASALFSSFLSH